MVHCVHCILFVLSNNNTDEAIPNCYLQFVLMVDKQPLSHVIERLRTLFYAFKRLLNTVFLLLTVEGLTRIFSCSNACLFWNFGGIYNHCFICLHVRYCIPSIGFVWEKSSKGWKVSEVSKLFLTNLFILGFFLHNNYKLDD